MIDLQDKIVVITGGEGLLGSAFVRHCRQAGAVAICGDIRSATDPDQHRYALDIDSEESIRRCVRDIVKRYGRIDGWVNNAYPRTDDWLTAFEKIPPASWRKNVDMHLNGYFLCSQIALEQMRSQGAGSLINLASIYGTVAPDFTVYEGTDLTSPAAYSAIKGGIVNFSRYLASYYGPSGVRINVLSPGGVFNGQPEQFVEKYEQKVPLRRMATADDIAPAVFFLLSDAARYVTGLNMLVDGVWTAI